MAYDTSVRSQLRGRGWLCFDLAIMASFYETCSSAQDAISLLAMERQCDYGIAPSGGV